MSVWLWPFLANIQHLHDSIEKCWTAACISNGKLLSTGNDKRMENKTVSELSTQCKSALTKRRAWRYKCLVFRLSRKRTSFTRQRIWGHPSRWGRIYVGCFCCKAERFIILCSFSLSTKHKWPMYLWAVYRVYTLPQIHAWHFKWYWQNACKYITHWLR